MRIAMFMPSLGPDALGWQVHRDFAEAVRALGHEFALLTTPRPTAPPAGNSQGGGGDDGRCLAPSAGAAPSALAPPTDAAGDIEVLPIRDRRWLAEIGRPFLRTGQLLPAAGALARYLRAHGDDVDLLHLEVAYPHGAAGALGAWRSGWRGRFAVTPMGEDVLVLRDRSYGMRRFPLPAGLVSWTLRRAAALRCISPLAERTIAALAPASPRRVIPLNISAEAAAAAAWDDDERSRFRAAARARIDADFDTAGRPLVLSFGRLHPFKGIDYLVEAAALVGDARVLVVGPSATVRPVGDVAEALRRQAERIGVTHEVTIAGPVHPSRALEVLAAADVVVVPSPLESLNKVCMEAAAVGTPFVVTETTGISAWVPQEGVGIVVPPRNPPAIAWGIEEIIDGHFRHDAAAAASFARQFSPRLIAEQVLDFYEEVLRR